METGARFNSSREAEDALIYLPRKTMTNLRKGQVIYDEHQPANELYLVVQGRVKVAVPVNDGTESLVDIYSTDDFFGESALLAPSHYQEKAVALDPVSLMSWSVREIEEQIQRQPKLGVALLQLLVKRSLDNQARLQSFALDKTPERLIRSLLRFSERLGQPDPDGFLTMPPITHQVMSEYVGTSREIITFQMNQLRQKGWVRYSRRGIQVSPLALKQHLAGRSHVPDPTAGPVAEKTLAAGDPSPLL